ncbi:MAG: hypothetical protein ACRD15_03625, partial [Vicinamibacterales bacterium]
DMAERAGRSSAYVAHHWEHQIVRLPRLRWLRAAARLAIYRLADKGEPRCDSAPVWEMQLVGDVAFYKQYVRDRSRPRHYARHGLVRAKPGHAPTQAHVPLTLSAAT